MARLAMYSDQLPPETDAMDRRLLEWLPPGARIGYLPSSPDPERAWFASREAYYERFDCRLSYFGVEEEFDASRRKELMGCDAIHLTGGNTFQFSYWLRERGMFGDLKAYAEADGVLIGVSAGAILMTPDIRTSFLCGDEPYPGLGDYRGLGLVDFLVLPHFHEAPSALSARDFELGRTTYVIPDGAGIIVDGDHVHPFGPVVAFAGS